MGFGRLTWVLAVLICMLPTAVAGERAYLIVLGVAQDGGVPQTGDMDHPGWSDPDRRRHVVSLGLVSRNSGKRWLFEATPDLPAQMRTLMRLEPASPDSVPDGIFITHAHMGHYAGLLHLGHESMGANGVSLYVMPRMATFLNDNGPWDQLLSYRNVVIQALTENHSVALEQGISVTPFRVPHRQEYSEVVGFRIQGPNRSALFIPDIDSWDQWAEAGVELAEVLASVDLAYLDATFFDNGELPGRDMSKIPHPWIRTTMDRLAGLPEAERAKVRFIHLNHSNPALWPDSDARKEILARGFFVAEEGDVEPL